MGRLVAIAVSLAAVGCGRCQEDQGEGGGATSPQARGGGAGSPRGQGEEDPGATRCRADEECETFWPVQCTCAPCGENWPSPWRKGVEREAPTCAPHKGPCPACLVEMREDIALCEQEQCILSRDSRERKWVHRSAPEASEEALKQAGIAFTHSRPVRGYDQETERGCKVRQWLIPTDSLEKALALGFVRSGVPFGPNDGVDVSCPSEESPQ